MDPKEQRGYLNNNPGNMDKGADDWQGEIKDPADPRLTPFQVHELTHGRFCVFVDAVHGIRALAKNLLSYYDKLGLTNVNAIIGEWAPPSENNTTNYIMRVCSALGVAPGSKIDAHERRVMRELVKAIIGVENGGQPYDDATIEAGLTAADIAA